MKKKLLLISGIIIAALCALCLLGCGRRKQEYVYDSSGVVYRLSYNDTAYVVSRYNGEATEVEILSECEGLPVIGIDNGAFREKKNLIGVVIPDSITDIGERTFYNCSGLKYVTIPSGITRIDYEAFFGCRGLEEIEMPNGITRIDHGAFQYCSGLESVTIPYGVTSIGESAFGGCSGLKRMTIPESVTEISRWAFSGCVGLTSIEIPRSVTRVGQDVLDGCVNITEAEVPTGALSSLPKDNLQTLVINGGSDSMRSYMFDGASKLTSITISSAVKVIETNVIPYIETAVIYCEAPEKPQGWSLHWCDYAQPVVWDCNNNDKDEDGYAYAFIDGLRYRLKDGEAAVIRQMKDTVGEITIPAFVIYKDSIYNVTAVGNGAFYGCRGLTGVTLPTNIVTIGNSAFSGCWSLKQIELPDGLKSIDGYAFYDCGELTDIQIPSSVTTIGAGAFNNGGGFTSIKIPDGVRSIEQSTFSMCDGLTTLQIPSSVTTIGDRAFNGCDSLSEVYYIGTAAQWEAIDIGADNSKLDSSAIYYYSETQPLVPGNYWHYAADWSTPEKW